MSPVEPNPAVAQQQQQQQQQQSQKLKRRSRSNERNSRDNNRQKSRRNSRSRSGDRESSSSSSSSSGILSVFNRFYLTKFFSSGHDHQGGNGSMDEEDDDHDASVSDRSSQGSPSTKPPATVRWDYRVIEQLFVFHLKNPDIFSLCEDESDRQTCQRFQGIVLFQLSISSSSRWTTGKNISSATLFTHRFSRYLANTRHFVYNVPMN